MTTAEELFDELEKCYSDVIPNMERDEFTSHEFIEKLSQMHQELYVRVLHEYSKNGQPFQTVHSIIAKRLKKKWGHLVKQVSTKPKSENIFGNYNAAALWRKVT